MDVQTLDFELEWFEIRLCHDCENWSKLSDECVEPFIRTLNENKESEFHSGGEQVQAPKLKKAKYRDAYVSTIAKFSTGKLRIVMLLIIPRINRLTVF